MPKFKCGQVVKHTKDKVYYKIEAIIENRRGFGLHSYECRVFGGTDLTILPEFSLESTESEFSGQP